MLEIIRISPGNSILYHLGAFFLRDRTRFPIFAENKTAVEESIFINAIALSFTVSESPVFQSKV